MNAPMDSAYTASQTGMIPNTSPGGTIVELLIGLYWECARSLAQWGERSYWGCLVHPDPSLPPSRGKQDFYEDISDTQDGTEWGLSPILKAMPNERDA